MLGANNCQPPRHSDWARTASETPWLQDPLVAGKRSGKNPLVIKDKAVSFALTEKNV